MKLKRLQMQGFKSFADKTELHFDQQIVGIVGPNGCGKSNIVDCIRWAMGEQSAKGLRGKEMADVIFAGTPSRKPAGFAEVSLIFDNADKQAPAPYTECAEIMITRRLYRTGESEYQINKVTVRLKDIHDLFLGTGSSAKAYSIVAQGKVDQVVLAKPEDRRFLIEEAAGIAKYKVRKQAAERKIETTQQNLDRVNDILKELERNARNLERQVEKAEKYRELQRSLKSLECDFLAGRLIRLDDQANSNQEALTSRQTELSSQQTELSRLESQIETLRLETLNREKMTSGDYESLMSGKDRLAKLETDQELAAQKIQLLGNQIEERKADLQRLGSKFQDQEGSKRQLLEELEKFQTEKSQADERLAAFRSAMDSASVKVQEAQADLEKSTERLQSFKAETAAQNQRKEMWQAELVDLELQRAERERRVDNTRKEIEGLSTRVSEVSRSQSDQVEKIQALKAAQEDCRRRKEELLEERSRLLSQKTQLESKVFEKDTQISNLQSLEAHALGYDPMALEMKEQTGQKFLMECLQFKSDYRALGESLVYHLGQYFVDHLTESTETPRWTALLTRENGQAPTQNCAAWLESSSDPRVTRILEQIEFVDQIDRASADLSHPQMDKEGRWQAPLGQGLKLWSSGTIAKEQSPFGRQQELLDLQSEIERIRSEVTAEDLKIQKNLADQEELRAQILDTESRLREAEAELEGLRNQKDQFSQRIAAQRSLEEQLQQELKDYDNKITERQKDLAELPGVQSLEPIEAEIQQKRLQLEETKGSLQSKESDWVEYRIQVGALAERIERLKQQCVSVDMAQSEYRHNQDIYQKDIEVWTEEIARLKQQRESAQQESESLRTQIQELDRRLAKVKEEMSGIRSQLESCEESRREIQKTKEEAAETLQNLELERQRLRLEAEEISRNLEERYQQTAGELLGGLTEDARQALLELNLSEIELEVKALRDRLNKFGDVNLVALTEYEEMKTRLDFMTRQREDLLKTLDSLQSIIDRINRISEFRFRETFAAINHNFQLLFPKLFGGGKAYMRLTDENNMLDTGVEIFAEPPGKKIQAMSLLSGGEKAMTSISLLFSLFAYRPSSFCILDEVDAPLDDINTRRYNEIIQEMSSLSQFIVITHNKRTMEVASTLFGVTMQDPGCSRLVGVNLNEAKAFTGDAVSA